MITLDVFFEEFNIEYTEGTATLYENLITNKVKLVISNHTFLNEIQYLINKAVKILKLRYKEIDVKIHWETANKVEEAKEQ